MSSRVFFVFLSVTARHFFVLEARLFCFGFSEPFA